MAKETTKKTAAKAADKKTAAKKADKKTTAKTADKKTTAKSAVKKTTVKTADKKTTTKAADKKTAAKTAAKTVAKKPAAKVAEKKTVKKADTSKLDALIKAALTDGKITDAERKVLEKRAKEEGFDKDELKMLLDAKLYDKKKTDKGKKEPAAEKKPAEKKVFKDPFDGLMVTVEGGVFRQNADIHYPNGDRRNKPSIWNYSNTRLVRLSTFKICKYQVTQAQWKAIMGNNPSWFKGDDLPVESVSWYDAQAFIKKLNEKTGKHYALPTEAQWEFAARGGNKSKGYQCAGCDMKKLGDYAWYEDNSFNTTNPVGKKKPNELGLYDMSGNVNEWCQDYRYAYPSGDIADPRGPSSGTERVARGGCYLYDEKLCTTINRWSATPDTILDNYGFRLVLLP